jgi:hypothetical protein
MRLETAPQLNAVVTLRNQVFPWLMILRVVPDGRDFRDFRDFLPGQPELQLFDGFITQFANKQRSPGDTDTGRLVRSRQ